MLGLIEQGFIALEFNWILSKKCISLNNEPCLLDKPTLINVNPHELSQELSLSIYG